MPGGTLEQFVKPGKLLPVDKVVEIIFKCTRALNFAHRLGIGFSDRALVACQQRAADCAGAGRHPLLDM